MCGIFAAVGPEVPESALERVFAQLRHRGPDGNGRFVDEQARLTLAHTRLAVIDLATGDQPIESPDGNIILVANGEIYDFERIRRELEREGYAFRTHSDSEIIIALYQRDGLRCFDRLRGEFAFLLYDKAKRILIAARDRFGVKPLYFSRLEQGFVFASEMKALFASGLVEPRLDVAALDPFLDQDPASVRFPFEGVEHVPPATYLTIDLDTLDCTTARYWSSEASVQSAAPVSEPSGQAAATAAAAVLERLEESVRLRLRADVPVGVYLSGGVDSTFVAALMRRNLSSPPHSFSISFPGSRRDEGEVARRAADVVGTEHHELAATKAMLWANLPRALWFSELPFVTLAPVGKFLLSEEARKHVTVVLTGEGADEVFLGYRSYFGKAIAETRAGVSKGANARQRRLKLPAIAHRLSLVIFHRSQRASVSAMRASVRQQADEPKPIINAVQEARLAAMPLDILCYLGDREEMAHSIEARLPFLDHELFEEARSIPVDLKLRQGLEKAVLRDAAQGILPDDFRLRRKAGFMLTSDSVDFFGADRAVTESLRKSHLSKQAFDRAQVFSHRAYRLATLIAQLPRWLPVRALKRIRRNASKVIMYMMQVHMLHDMFIADPAWLKEPLDSAGSAKAAREAGARAIAA